MPAKCNDTDETVFNRAGLEIESLLHCDVIYMA